MSVINKAKKRRRKRKELSTHLFTSSPSTYIHIYIYKGKNVYKNNDKTEYKRHDEKKVEKSADVTIVRQNIKHAFFCLKHLCVYFEREEKNNNNNNNQEKNIFIFICISQKTCFVM